MKKTKTFDVLIVYTDSAASSAAKANKVLTQPFAKSSGRTNYNLAYAYFLEACNAFGLTAAFSNTADIIGPGSCGSYWLYLDNSWKAVSQPCYSRQIFDK